MNKILAALVATTVSCGAFAQASAPAMTAPTTAPGMGRTTAPAASGAMAMEKASGSMTKKHHTEKKHDMDKKHHDKSMMKAASKPAA